MLQLDLEDDDEHAQDSADEDVDDDFESLMTDQQVMCMYRD